MRLVNKRTLKYRTASQDEAVDRMVEEYLRLTPGYRLRLIGELQKVFCLECGKLKPKEKRVHICEVDFRL